MADRSADQQGQATPDLLDACLSRLLRGLRGQIRAAGGLWDPLLAAPTPRDHYGQTGAALALLLSSEEGDPLWRTPLSAWLEEDTRGIGHHPFNRFLLLLLRERLRHRSDCGADIRTVDAAMGRCRLQGRYPSNNWWLLAQLCRLMEAEGGRRRGIAQGMARRLERWTTRAGGFVDFPASPQSAEPVSTPMAYHHKAVFVAVMAARHCDLPMLREALQRMLAWTALTFDGYRHAGGLGRSTHSLFGDGCLVASLALLGFGSRESDPRYGAGILRGVLSRWITQFRRDDLLALNPGSVADARGWDPYMHLSVYNAWTAAIVAWSVRASRVEAGDVPPPETVAALRAPGAVAQDPQAGVLRVACGADAVFMLTTRGQVPQGFSRGQAEFRYAGGVPFHAVSGGRVLCPPPARLDAAALLEVPARAGWTPVFRIDGELWAATLFATTSVAVAESQVSVSLEGRPLRLLRRSPQGALARLRHAAEWRLGGRLPARREVMRRRGLEGVSVHWNISISRRTPELAYELLVSNRTRHGAIEWLNPAGHLLVGERMPRHRSAGLDGDGIAPVELPPGVDHLWQQSSHAAAMPGAVAGSLPPVSLPEGRHRCRLMLAW